MLTANEAGGRSYRRVGLFLMNGMELMIRRQTCLIYLTFI
jgi:hypothetical protein